jgi:hypothetical protein
MWPGSPGVCAIAHQSAHVRTSPYAAGRILMARCRRSLNMTLPSSGAVRNNEPGQLGAAGQRQMTRNRVRRLAFAGAAAFALAVIPKS